MELFEDYIEDINQEDIATDNLESSSVLEKPEEHYQTSIQFYTSLFLAQGKNDLLAFKRNIERLARVCPQLRNEMVGPLVGWGSTLDSYNGFAYIFEDGDDISRYNFIGNGYYCIEVFYESGFTNVQQIMRLASQYYVMVHEYLKLHISYMYWTFNGKKPVDMDTIMTTHEAYNNLLKKSDVSDLAVRQASKRVLKVANNLMPEKIADNFFKVNDIFGVKVASIMESDIIRDFQSNHRLYNLKCKKVTVKAAALKPLKEALVDLKSMMGNNSPDLILQLYDAVELFSMGRYFTGPALHRDVREIIQELNSNPRHFQQIRFLVIGEGKSQYVIFIGFLGLFWVECIQKLVLASFVYETSFGDWDLSYNKIHEFTKDIMRRFGGDEQAAIRLYNDIVNTAEK